MSGVLSEKDLHKNIEVIIARLGTDTSRFKFAGVDQKVHKSGLAKGAFIHDVVKFESDYVAVFVDRHNCMVSVQVFGQQQVLMGPNRTNVEVPDVFFRYLGEQQRMFDDQVNRMNAEKMSQNGQFGNNGKIIN